MPKTTTSPLATLEADLAVLLKRGAALERRRDDAAAALLTATAERRRLLVEGDNPPAADLAKADRAHRDAQPAHDAAVDALAEIDSRIADLQGRIERLKAADERERQAAAFEAAADVADRAVDRMRRAAADLAAAHSDLATALSSDMTGAYSPRSEHVGHLTAAAYYDFEGTPHGFALSPEDVACRVAGSIITGALPGYVIATEVEARELKVNRMPTRTLAPAVDLDAARALLAEPLRARAADLRRSLQPA